jgi:hypothetical protein
MRGDVLRSRRSLGQDLEIALATELLGPDATLVRLLVCRAERRLQLGAVIGLAMISVFGAVGHAAWAVPVFIACVPVALLLTVMLVSIGIDLRYAVLASIAAGHAGLPMRVVEREVRRLQSGEARTRMAGIYAGLGLPPGLDGRVAARACVVVDPELVKQVRTELERVADLVASRSARIEGLAAADWVLGGPSALFGDDVDELRRQLNRVVYLLQAPTSDQLHRRPAGEPVISRRRPPQARSG